MNFFLVFSLFLYPIFYKLFTLISNLVIQNIAGIITGLLTSAVVTILLIDYIYKKNYRIEVEKSLNAVYNEIKYNNAQLSKFEDEVNRIKKYWMILKNYNLALNQWEDFQADFGNKSSDAVKSNDFIGRSWILPKGVSSRQTYQDSKFLYQFLSDNAYQAFIAHGHHLEIKGCYRIGDFMEWNHLSLLYKGFDDFNEITQKIENDISVFLGIVQNSIINHRYPSDIQLHDLESLNLITYEVYQKIPLQLKKASHTGFGEIPTDNPDLTINGNSFFIEKMEYFTYIRLSDNVIYSIPLTEKLMNLPFRIFPHDLPVSFDEYIENCHDFLISSGKSLQKEINKLFVELYQSEKIDPIPSFEKWKEKMLV